MVYTYGNAYSHLLLNFPHQLHLTNLADAVLAHKLLNVQMIFCRSKTYAQFDAPIFVEDKFDDHGKWMDGWETRRKRHAGYDWCIVKLGVAGKIKALDIDTTFFTGNYPASAS
jgi:allantoicase